MVDLPNIKRAIRCLSEIALYTRDGRALVSDENGSLVVTGDKDGGSLDVNVQDQHTQALDLRFIQQQSPLTTLSAQADPEDTTITIDDTTGYVDGCIIGIFTTAGEFYFGRQVGAPIENNVDLDTPVDKTFATGSNVICAIDNMVVDGSDTPEVFQVGPVGGETGVSIDITRIMGYMQDNVVMDDAKFGGISALVNGVVLRKNNGDISNIWNVKSNGQFSLLTYDFKYTDKAPAGSYGARFRNSYGGQSEHGVTIRLDPGDILEVIIQDDLTDLQVFNMMAQGHVVENG